MNALLARLRYPSRICPIRLHFAGFDIVSQINLQYVVAQISHQAAVFHREKHLHSPDEIARHQIGAAEKNLIAAAIVKVIDSSVLQKASNDADHPYVVADAWNS